MSDAPQEPLSAKRERMSVRDRIIFTLKECQKILLPKGTSLSGWINTTYPS
ncbi:hypothetical protein [Brasilonema sp. UFV-L1]|uniref:hypothetical protein n=1 Tax=Brasilonema sp. UFV-L1 TaxID=2234130 RepID=UPI001B7D1570|nr:hypothetical protein [Brasilonema sp. UFV-L1]